MDAGWKTNIRLLFVQYQFSSEMYVNLDSFERTYQLVGDILCNVNS